MSKIKISPSKEVPNKTPKKKTSSFTLFELITRHVRLLHTHKQYPSYYQTLLDFVPNNCLCNNLKHCIGMICPFFWKWKTNKDFGRVLPIITKQHKEANEWEIYFWMREFWNPLTKNTPKKQMRSSNGRFKNPNCKFKNMSCSLKP